MTSQAEPDFFSPVAKAERALAVCRDVYYRACGRKVACDALVDIRIAAEYPNRADWLKSKPDDWSRLLERAIVEAKFQTEIRDAASDALDEAYREIERAIACASEVDAIVAAFNAPILRRREELKAKIAALRCCDADKQQATE